MADKAGSPECRDNRRRMYEGEAAGDLVKAAIDRAVERFGDRGDGLFNAAGFGVALMELAGLKGVIDGNLVRAILSGRADVAREPDASYFRRVLGAPSAVLEPADAGTFELLAKLRSAGWSVAVHNDYRLQGVPHTFWLFTNADRRWIKGEGTSDWVALREAYEEVLLKNPGKPLAAPAPAVEPGHVPTCPVKHIPIGVASCACAAPAVEGEPPEDHSKHDDCAWPDEPCNQLTFAEAMALPPDQVEVKWDENNDWRKVSSILTAFPLESWRVARYRRKPAPALTRSGAIVQEHFAGDLRATTKDALECSERVLREFGTRLLQLTDGQAVDAFKRALEQAEREFLGPGEGSR